ncbi:MAG TPA: gliding motility-associated C-terminal domain-containing protein [Brumimicrobium sp.]|nr:gliding motility-associated C-terminal domain-containing protein [Brumimicrobium sp.]
MKQSLILVLFLFSVSIVQAQAPCAVDFTIGNDTTLSCGESHTLQATPGMDSYAWSTGSSQSAITVSSTGTYTCYATELGPDLVVNGDFSAGNNGFQTDYVLGTGGQFGQLSNEGTFAIANNASAAHDNFSNCFDHTTGDASGNMLVVNGASTPGTNVWKQTITVAPNTDYLFSMWATSVISENPGTFVFTINGQQIGAIMNLPSNTCQWIEFNESWNSGAITQAEIAIENMNTQSSGNDFAIDDISFRPQCLYTDQVTITIPPGPEVTVNPTEEICEGEEIALTATSPNPNLTFYWSPGNLTGSTILVSPAQQTTYTVIGTDPDGCESQPKTVAVNINPIPVLSFDGDELICEGSTGDIEVTSTVPQTDFLWTENNSTSPNISVQPNSTTTYEVTATTPKGCVAVGEYVIEVLEELEVEISGNTVFCEGDENNLQANANLTGTTFLWMPRNESGDTLLTSINDLGWVYLEGTHPICGVATDSIQLVLGEQPVVSIPDSITLCLGDEATVIAESSIPNSDFTWFPGNLSGASQIISSEESNYFYVQANAGGCQSELDSIFVTINTMCDITVPNVFTPNNDGINDFFKLGDTDGMESLECVILNRWGNLVFESKVPSFEWDGTDRNGNKLNDGTYFYKINAKSTGGDELEKTGFVQIFNH